jgi:hypothetical protein
MRYASYVGQTYGKNAIKPWGVAEFFGRIGLLRPDLSNISKQKEDSRGKNGFVRKDRVIPAGIMVLFGKIG